MHNKLFDRTDGLFCRQSAEFDKIHALVLVHIVGDRAQDHIGYAAADADMTDGGALHFAGKRAEAVVEQLALGTVGDKNIAAGNDAGGFLYCRSRRVSRISLDLI